MPAKTERLPPSPTAEAVLDGRWMVETDSHYRAYIKLDGYGYIAEVMPQNVGVSVGNERLARRIVTDHNSRRNRYSDEAGIAKDALEMWQHGASNPRAIARCLTDAIDWYVDNKGGSDAVKNAPPVEVMLAQLLWLCGIGIGSCGRDIEPALKSAQALVALHPEAK